MDAFFFPKEVRKGIGTWIRFQRMRNLPRPFTPVRWMLLVMGSSHDMIRQFLLSHGKKVTMEIVSKIISITGFISAWYRACRLQADSLTFFLLLIIERTLLLSGTAKLKVAGCVLYYALERKILKSSHSWLLRAFTIEGGRAHSFQGAVICQHVQFH